MSRAKTFFGRCSSRWQEFFSELNSQRQTGEFVDMVLMVQNMRFRCHRAILSSTPYFKAILSKRHTEGITSNVVELQNIDPLCFSKILDYVYTGQITISQDDVKDILQAAHELKLKKMKKYCLEFMQNTLSRSNCLLFMQLANLYGFSDLKSEAKKKAITHFSKAKENDGFLTLSSDELVDLLRNDLLKVTSEDEVTTSVIQWLDHDPDSRKLALPTILQEIHLSCVRVSVLRELESHPAVQESDVCLAKVKAAKEEHLSGTKQLTAGAEGGGTTPKRKPPTSDDLIIIVGGWKAEELIPPLQSIICLNPDDRHCYHITDLPLTALGYMSVTNTRRKLYVSGGRLFPMIDDGPHTVTSAPVKQAFCYDFATDTWEKLPDMPRGRAEHQSVVVDGKLYLVGGDVEGAFNDKTISIDCYDLETGTWIKPPTGPQIKPLSKTNLKVHVAAACGGKLVLITEFTKRSRRTLRVHALDVLNGEWVYSDIAWRGYISSSRWIDVGISLNAIDDKLYFRAESNLFAYDVKTESLTKVKITAAPSGIKFLCTEPLNKRWLDAACVTIIQTDRVYHTDIYNSLELSYRRKDAYGQLPFRVVGCSVLGTKKSRVGWYCQDRLVKLRRGNDNDNEKNDDDEDETHSNMRPVHHFKRLGPSTVHFKNVYHSGDLSVELEHLFKTGTYADVELEVEGQKVCCHRAVLATTPYFKTMFSCNLKESNSRVVKLCGINFNSLKKIVRFLYKGSIHISENNVQEILEAAHMLQIDEITEFCQKVIARNIHTCNCIDVMRLANLYGLSDLEKKARREAATHFSEVKQNEEFLSLSTVQLVDLLGHFRLEVTSEDEVVTCVLRWLDHDPESRKTSMPAILQEISLPYVKVSTLERLESHPGIRESPECLAKVTAVKEGHLTGKRQLLKHGHTNSKRLGISGNLEIHFGGCQWVEVEDEYQHSIPFDSIICRDPNNQQYLYITKLPTSVACRMSVARAGRHLYVTGGYGPQSDNQSASRLRAFRYDFPADTWTKLPDMPRGRAGHQSIVVEGKLYVVGGDDVKATSVSMDCYDLKEEAWIKPPTLPTIDPSSRLRLVDTSSNHVVLFEISVGTRGCATEDALNQVLGRNLRAKRSKLVVHVFKVAATVPVTNNGDDHSESDFTDEDDEDTDDDLAAILDPLETLGINDEVTDNAYVRDEEENEEEDEYDRNEQWVRSDILVLHNLDGHDIFVITVDDIVYFHFVNAGEIGHRSIHHVKVYNVKENTVIDVWTVTDDGYYYAFGRFKDAIINGYHKFLDTASKELKAPIGLSGQSILTARKRSIGWYCRDLAKFEGWMVTSQMSPLD
ncbi:uncharacterized protein LOC144919516 [Branchiostoma floridae x Branchiostoma belcheri]